MKRFALNPFFVAALILTLGLCLSVGGLALAIPGAQYVCQEQFDQSDMTSPKFIDDDLYVTVKNFFPRTCIVTFSADVNTSVGGQVTLSYSIDDGLCSGDAVIGPVFLLTNAAAQASTAVGVIELGKGIHTIQPCFRSSESGNTVTIGRRCLIVECWTK